MNNYTITKCTYCRKPIVVNDIGDIKVHGGANADQVMDRIRGGETITEIAKDFCDRCGNEMPCGCSNPRPQDGLPSA